MALFPNRILAVSAEFQDWLHKTFAPTVHEHPQYALKSELVNTTPDWARAKEYTLGPGNSASLAYVYRTMADGYIYFTFHAGHNDNDCDYLLMASTLFEAITSTNNMYDYDKFILSANADDGINLGTTIVPVRGATHPWYVRYGAANDMICCRMYFVPFVSTPTTEYLKLVFTPTSNMACRHLGTRGFPGNCILDKDGARLRMLYREMFQTSGPYNATGRANYQTDYFLYARTTDTPTVNGVKVTRTCYKYSVTGAATSGYCRYNATRVNSPTISGDYSYNYNYVQGRDEVWLYNIGNQWQLVAFTKWEDIAPQLMIENGVRKVSLPPNRDASEIKTTNPGLTSAQAATTSIANINGGTVYIPRYRHAHTFYSNVITGESTAAIGRFVNLNFTNQLAYYNYDKRWSPIEFPNTATSVTNATGFWQPVTVANHPYIQTILTGAQMSVMDHTWLDHPYK